MLTRTIPAEAKVLRYDDQGRVLCRWCLGIVERPRRTFCSAECVHEWTVRSSTSYARRCVKKRDKGICARCGIDTEVLRLELKGLLLECRKAGDKAAFYVRIGELGIKGPEYKAYRPHSLWEADHIVPVSQGGGCCGLDNLRTLCWRCHREATAALRASRRKASGADEEKC